MEIGPAVAIVGSLLALGTNLFFMARWSGKVDADYKYFVKELQNLEAQAKERHTENKERGASMQQDFTIKFQAVMEEFEKQRPIRHEMQSNIARHEGQIRNLELELARQEIRLSRTEDRLNNYAVQKGNQ